MELYDYFMQLLESHVKIKKEEYLDVRNSLFRSVSLHQYQILRDKHDKFLGFYTWEFENEFCGITNLLIIPDFRGTYNLKRVISFLRREHPNVRFTWHNRKRNRIFMQREGICVG